MKKIVQFPDRYSENKIAEQVKNRLKNDSEDRLVTFEVKFSFITKDENLVSQRNFEDLIKDQYVGEAIIQNLEVEGRSLKSVVKNFRKGIKNDFNLMLQINDLKRIEDI